MDRYGYRCDHVELIHAADSVETIGPSDGFLPSKMSRQPIRVAQPPAQPPTHSRAQKSFQSSSSSSVFSRYDDLVQVAEQQRRLIDANRQRIQDREARGNRVENAPIRLAVLRNEVLFEEREMARLKMMERETQEVAARRMIAERQLNDLQLNYTSQEQHLRGVISKITSLQAQLEVLRRRRLAALNAARDQQQRLVSSQIRPAHSSSAQSLFRASTAASSLSAVASNSEIILRNDSSHSKSSVLGAEYSASAIGSNIKQRDLPDCDAGMLRRIAPASNTGRLQNIASYDFSYRPRASVEPFQSSFQFTRPESVMGGNGRELTLSCSPQRPAKPSCVSTFGKDRANFGIVERIVVNRDISPSPPKDPYPTTSENTSDSETMVRSEERKKLDPANCEPSSGLAKDADKELQQQQQQPNGSVKFGGTVVLDDELLLSDMMDNAKLARADQISIRPDNLRAAKRRSWALQDNSPSDETEYIRKILLDEQRKGRTHLVVGCNIGSLFAPSNKTPVSVKKPEVIQEEEKEAVEDISSIPTEYACEFLMKDIQLDELPIEIDQQVEEEKQIAVAMEEVVEEVAKEVEATNRASGVAELIKAAPERGILRANGLKNASRKVVFDPLALLLDAALEGEMDLVKTSAAKLSNISACNDEGITALHNAICAGHYEIVRYLVDSYADVNAQDSDGWTPLHCAASCNNLPMVKLLVENGACIFAQTLSDLETPAEKCEEDEDGYEGCQLYLKAADQWAGMVNNGFMYAAYDYDKEQDDELSYQAGACLRVLEKGSNDEKAWWRCETTAGTPEQGLVPRNYLSLYPILSHRSADFKMFDLPQVPRIHDSEEEKEEKLKERRRINNNSMDEKSAAENEGETNVEQPVPIPVS